jgi:hypothetical protein
MTDRAFAPYALQIGHLSRSWNQLHENLCGIFARVVSPHNRNIAYAIWHEQRSDRTQRGMLRSACEAHGAIDTNNRQTAIDDIRWMLERCRDLADQRNIAIHAPMFVGMDTATGEFMVEPHNFQNNPNANRLYGKAILHELRYFRAKSDALKEYALKIWFALGHTERTWPQRPTLPTREQLKPRKKSNRTTASARKVGQASSKGD